MASLLANGVSTLSPQPTYETKLPKLLLHPTKLEFPNFKPRTQKPSRLVKVRADVSYDRATNPSTATAATTTTTTTSDEKIREILRNRDYDKKFGFTFDIDSFSIPKGLSRETIRLISTLKEEPDWMLEFRLNAYEKFLKMKEPNWSDNRYPPIDFQDICYYSAPNKKPSLNSLEEADPELLRY